MKSRNATILALLALVVCQPTPGDRGSMTVVVPDLPQSHLRFIQ